MLTFKQILKLAILRKTRKLWCSATTGSLYEDSVKLQKIRRFVYKQTNHGYPIKDLINLVNKTPNCGTLIKSPYRLRWVSDITSRDYWLMNLPE